MSDSPNDRPSSNQPSGDDKANERSATTSDAFSELAGPPETMKPVVSEAPVKGWRLPKALVIVGGVVLIVIGLVIGLLIATLVNGQSSQNGPGGRSSFGGGGYGNVMPGEGGSGQMPSDAPGGQGGGSQQ